MIEETKKQNVITVRIFDLFSGGQNDIRQGIKDITTTLDKSDLMGPLYTITHELTVNGLKAVYKRIFYERFISEIGLDDVGYEQWLMLFKTEIEEHNAENFARVVREMGTEIEVHIRLGARKLRIAVVNEGTPSGVELERLRRSILRSQAITDLGELIEMQDESGQGEGASLGLPLIILSLRRLGVGPGGFRVGVRRGYTVASFVVPRVKLENYDSDT
ncbi:MAG: hypothetical protein HS115_03720 [Spirochaetales bacterium]|nr:hypothetical protein [Spirochaetales bacterium]